MLKTGRAAAVPAFLAMDISAEAQRLAAPAMAAGKRVLHLEVGQPGTPAPATALAAAADAMRAHALGYTEALGRLSLRRRISTHYRDWYGVDVPPERILITNGASGAFPLAFLAAFDPGDRIAMAAPYYPPYVNILRALGMVPEILPTGPEHRFQPTIAHLEALERPPAGLLLASPGNPAGTMLRPDEFARLAAWCDAHGVRLISDEIYHGLHWEAPLTTAANLKVAVVINSFSKYFSMTGWRVGWMVLPEDLIRAAECLAQNFFICAPHVSQIAAEAAFDGQDELRGHLDRYRAARAYLREHLPGAGFTDLAPAEGAFYIYANISALGMDSVALSHKLLRTHFVATTPGVDFDAARGLGYLRMSYCGAVEDIRQAVERLVKFKEESSFF